MCALATSVPNTKYQLDRTLASQMTNETFNCCVNELLRCSNHGWSVLRKQEKINEKKKGRRKREEKKDNRQKKKNKKNDMKNRKRNIEKNKNKKRTKIEKKKKIEKNKTRKINQKPRN